MPGTTSLVTGQDLYLFNEGTHARLWERLGSHAVVRDGTAGTQFAVWAPNAGSVSVIGDFNGWQPAAHPMTRMPDGGWTIRLELPHGHHQYVFLVDGQPTLDPNAMGKVHNERNEVVSLIAIS